MFERIGETFWPLHVLDANVPGAAVRYVVLSITLLGLACKSLPGHSTLTDQRKPQP